MKKAFYILQNLNTSDKDFKLKVKLLAEIIDNPTTGHICPDNLVIWAGKCGL